MAGALAVSIGKGSLRPESRDAEDPPETLRIFADPDFADLDTAGKIAQQLETPPGLWQPDGHDAARERLEALEQAEEAAAGLEDEEVDERLWKGSYEQGWRVYIKGKRNDGHYWYVTPKGRRLGSKTEAMSLGVQRKQPTSRRAMDTTADWSRTNADADYVPT